MTDCRGSGVGASLLNRVDFFFNLLQALHNLKHHGITSLSG